MNKISTIRSVASKYMLILYALFFLQAYGTAQDIYKFERIGVIQGLSQNTVTCIFQDYQGYLWFGTKDGLNRYDGYTFKTFTHDNSNEYTLPNNDISVIFEDSDNNLWIGTDGGLSKYNRSTELFTTFSSQGLRSLNVRTIIEEDQNTLLVGTYLGGLHKFNKTTEEFTSIAAEETPQKGNMNIRAVYKIGDHKLWVGSEDGIRIFDRQKGAYSKKLSFSNDYSIQSGKINKFYEDKEGNFWIGTYGNGIKMLPKASDQLISFSHDPTSTEGLSNNFILAIAELDDHIFFGTSYGLNVFDKKTKKFQVLTKDISPTSLSSNRIRSIFIDRLGIMWVGTDNGINVYDPGREKFSARGNTARDLQLFSNNHIRSIYKVSDSILWLGSDGEGLFRFNRVANTISTYNILNGKLTSNVITDILPNDANTLWLGTESDGLILFDKATETYIKHYQYTATENAISANNIRKLASSKKGGIWIATDGGGLNYFDKEKGTFKSYKSDINNQQSSLSSNFITSLWEDTKGNMWVGTYGGGISYLDVENQQFTSYTSDSFDSTTLSSNLVNAVLEDDNGKLWIGTYSGLNSYHVETGNFSQYSPSNSKSYTINAIVKDGNILWLSTNKGLLSFNTQDSTFKLYDVKDGLSDNQFITGAYYQAEDGEVFLGTPNGFTSFYPSIIKANSYKPPIVLTDFFLSGKPVKIGGESPLTESISQINELTLNYDQRDFSIEFSALNFRLPEKNQYRYKLDGYYIQDWTIVDANNRKATYTNLEPKDYTFRVQASNNDGVWNDTGIALPITITTPYWMTNLAKAIYVLAILFTIFMIYRLRIRQIERTQQELKAQVQARTKEIEEKNQELFQKAEELAAQKEEILQINDKLESMFDQLENEKDKSENMLLNILPKETAKELKEKGFYTPRHYNMVSVLFTDFKGFTTIAENLSPNELIKELDYFFQYFDKVVEKHNLEKIKTIGDAYMCAGGIPKPNVTNPIDIVLAGLEITHFSHRVNKERISKGQVPWELRIGINTGELVSGVVGKKKFAYDVWGDAVNLASRMESSAAPGRVNISGNTYEHIKDFFDTEYRGKVFAKGKGEVDMYYVNRIKPELSLDEDGYSPNAEFRTKVKELMMNPNRKGSMA